MVINNEDDLIKKLQNEFDEIDYQIKNQKKIDKRNERIKNLKININISKVILPYVIIPVITYVGLCNFNKSPLVLEELKKNKSSLKTNHLDLSNINQDYNIENVYNIIYYYGKWVFNNDKYERIIKKYCLDNNQLKKIISIKNDSEIIDYLNKYLKYNEIHETKDHISDIELKEKDYYQTFLYSEKDGEYVLEKQTFYENFLDVINYLFINIIGESIISVLLKKKYRKIQKENEKIKSEYHPLDIEELSKKLIIRKNNLERIKG